MTNNTIVEFYPHLLYQRSQEPTLSFILNDYFIKKPLEMPAGNIL